MTSIGDYWGSDWRQALNLGCSTQGIQVARGFARGLSTINGTAATSLMSVEFLTDEQAKAYGRFAEKLTRPEFECFFFLNEEGQSLIAKQGGDLSRLAFAPQMRTVR